MSIDQRIAALEGAVLALRARRDEIIEVLMWEICKVLVNSALKFVHSPNIAL